VEGLRPNAAPTPAPPAGDEHVFLLAQEIDDVVSAQILLKRCLNLDRSNVEVVNAANVLSDNYDRLCSHLSQFYFWRKYWTQTSGKASDFSIAAQDQVHDLANRLRTEVQNGFLEIGDLLEKKPRYASDPNMLAPVQRLITSANTMKALIARADKE
jgi:hypothetical protein